jgi:hypothetical protein
LAPGYFAAAQLLIASAHKDMQAASLRAAWKNFFLEPLKGAHFQKRMKETCQGTFETIPALNDTGNINFL